MQFIPIDVKRDRETIVPFRKDAFAVSFGTDETFGSVEKYLFFIEENSQRFPKGFVLVMDGEKAVGQLELAIRDYKEQKIGYIHLYYLIPEERGSGKGDELVQYARQFFNENGVKEYHLRVSPTNLRARAFYKKYGMEEIGEEMDGTVIRMKAIL